MTLVAPFVWAGEVWEGVGEEGLDLGEAGLSFFCDVFRERGVEFADSGEIYLVRLCFLRVLMGWLGVLPLEGEDTAACVSLLCFCLLDEIGYVHNLR